MNKYLSVIIGLFMIMVIGGMSCTPEPNYNYHTNTTYVYDPASISGEQQITSPDWRNETIYFIMIDRFANGNESNDVQLDGGMETGPTEAKWNGGDFKGIIEKLDYVKEMGFTAIWITPPIENQAWDASIPYGGYHGYWASCFTNTDPHFGTLEEYKALVRRAHSLGLRVIQDIVVNHTGNFFKMDSVNGTLTINTNGYPKYPTEAYLSNSIAYYLANGSGGSNEVNFFHWTPDITDWKDWNQLTNYQASSLDDINTENPLVLQKMKEWFNYWIEEVGIDGVRIDTVRNVPKNFWKDFCYSRDSQYPGMRAFAEQYEKTNFIMFGEVWTPGAADEDALAGSYTTDGTDPIMHSVIHYPLYSAIQKVFALNGATSYLRDVMVNWTNYYRDDAQDILVTFVDNHDNQRFISQSDLTRTKMALLTIYSLKGVPCVYYGTEQAFKEQRAAMFQGGYKGNQLSGDSFDTTSDMYKFVKNLNLMRQAYDVLRLGSQAVVSYDSAGPGIFSYKREYNGKSALVVMNTASTTKYIDGLDTGYGTETEMVNILQAGQTETLTTDSSGKIYTTIPAYTFKLFVPSDEYIEFRE